MYKALKNITRKPEAFEIYTADVLWTTPHIAKNMLQFHLDEKAEPASRNRVFLDKSIQFIRDRFAIKHKSIIDFGCGPGLYTTAFSKLGATVTGVDFSRNSLEYARQTGDEENLNITYIEQNYLEFETKKFYDLATLIYCDFCALSPAKRAQLLKIIYQTLKPDGQFFFDILTKNMFYQQTESSHFEHQNNDFFCDQPHFLFTNNFKYDEFVTLHHYSIVEKESQWDIYNWLQYFDLESITAELEAHGFEIEEIYNNVAGDPFTDDSESIALVCKKK